MPRGGQIGHWAERVRRGEVVAHDPAVRKRRWELLDFARYESARDAATALPVARFLVDLGQAAADECFTNQAQANLMAVYAHLGKLGPAVDIYDQALDRYGLSVQGACALCRAYVLRSYAHVLAVQGRSSAALVTISEAVAVAPPEHAVFVHCVARRANIHWVAGRYTEAAEDYSTALAAADGEYLEGVESYLDAKRQRRPAARPVATSPMVRALMHSWVMALAHAGPACEGQARQMLPLVEALYKGQRGLTSDRLLLRWLTVVVNGHYMGSKRIKRQYESLVRGFAKQGRPADLLAVTIAAVPHFPTPQGARMVRATLADPCLREFDAGAPVIERLRDLLRDLEAHQPEDARFQNPPHAITSKFWRLYEDLLPELSMKLNPIEA